MRDSREAFEASAAAASGCHQSNGCGEMPIILLRRTADAVTISTDLGQRRSLVDTRTLERTYVDGDTIKMELVLTTARGDTVRITRYLVRSALPAPAPVAAAVAPPG